MKAIYCTIFFLLYALLGVHAQAKHTFSLKSGYTYNSLIKLNEQEVEDSRGFLFTIGGVKKLFVYKKNSFELGLAAKTVFASGKINNQKFSASTLRLLIPLRLTFPVSDKIELSTGVVVQNNIDFNRVDLRFRDKYSWRFDLLGEIKYFVYQDLFVTATGNFNLGKIPDPFLFNDPKVAFLVGVGKRVLIVRKKKDARKAKRKLKRKNKKNKS